MKAKDDCERIFLIVYLIWILSDNFYVFVEIVTEGKRKKSSPSELHKVCISFPFNLLFTFRVTDIESILLFVFYLFGFLSSPEDIFFSLLLEREGKGERERAASV